MDQIDRIDSTPLRTAQERTALGEASFVLSALGIAHSIDFDGVMWVLSVARVDAGRADNELENYRKEKSQVPPRPPRIPVIDSGWAGVAGYLLVIWALPTLEWRALSLPWRDGGEMQASSVLAGQWWRTVTSLTLHADLGHLAANSLFGAVMGLLVGRNFGSGLGWLLILLCGAAGNVLDALWRTEDFTSIGASTATFAAVGLVGSFVWRLGYFRTADWRRSFAPIAATLALLAYTGTSGENTDVVAHVMGLSSGLACGAVVAGFDLRRIGIVGQWCAGAAAMALVTVAWWLAL